MFVAKKPALISSELFRSLLGREKTDQSEPFSYEDIRTTPVFLLRSLFFYGQFEMTNIGSLAGKTPSCEVGKSGYYAHVWMPNLQQHGKTGTSHPVK